MSTELKSRQTSCTTTDEREFFLAECYHGLFAISADTAVNRTQMAGGCWARIWQTETLRRGNWDQRRCRRSELAEYRHSIEPLRV